MRKKILLIPFLLVIIFTSSTYSARDSSTQEIMKDIRNNNLEKELKRCEDILNNPENERAVRAAIFHKFRILKKSGKLEEALNFLNSAQEKYAAKEIPTSFPETLPLTIAYEISISIPAWRAEIYGAQNEYIKAQDELIALKKLLDKYVEASRKEATKYLVYRKLPIHMQLALYYRKTGDYDAAVSELEDAIECGESFFLLDEEYNDRASYVPTYMTFVDLHERIGDLYKEMGKTKKALDQYHLALENMEKLYVPPCISEGNISTKAKAIPRLTDKIKQLKEGLKTPNP